MTDTQWNGEPCVARQITAVVADNTAFPAYWARPFVGMRRKTVEVTYGGDTFYLDDEAGEGWHKVTHGGSPWFPHSNLTVDPASVEPRDDTSNEFDYPRDPDAEVIVNMLPPDVQRRIRAQLAAEAAEGRENTDGR